MTNSNSRQAENELFALLGALQNDEELVVQLKASEIVADQVSLIESQGFRYELIIEGCSSLEREATNGNASFVEIDRQDVPLSHRLNAIKKLLVNAESGPLKSRFLEYQQVIQTLAGGKGSSWTKSITNTADQIGDDANDVYEQTSSAVSNTAQAVENTGKASGDIESEISKSENSFEKEAGETGKAVTDISKAQNELTSAVAGTGLANQTEELAVKTAGQSLGDLGKAAIDGIGGNKAGAEDELKNAGNSAVNGLDNEDKIIATEGENVLKAGTDNGKLFEALDFGQKEGLGSFLQKNVYDPAMNALQSFGNTTEADRAEAFKKEGDTLKAWGDETYEFAKDEPEELSEMTGSAIESGENWAEYGLSMGTDKEAEDRAQQDDIQAQTAGVNALDDADKETFTTFDAGMAAVADTSDGLVGNDTGKAADMALGLIPGVGEAVMAGQALSLAAELDYNHNENNQLHNEEQKNQEQIAELKQENREQIQSDVQDLAKAREARESRQGLQPNLSDRDRSYSDNRKLANESRLESDTQEPQSKQLDQEQYSSIDSRTSGYESGSQQVESRQLDATEQSSPSGRYEAAEIAKEKSGTPELYGSATETPSRSAGEANSDSRDQASPSGRYEEAEIAKEKGGTPELYSSATETPSINDSDQFRVPKHVVLDDGSSLELTDQQRSAIGNQNTTFTSRQKDLIQRLQSGEIDQQDYEASSIRNARDLLAARSKTLPDQADVFQRGSELMASLSSNSTQTNEAKSTSATTDSLNEGRDASNGNDPSISSDREPNPTSSNARNSGHDSSSSSNQSANNWEQINTWMGKNLGVTLLTILVADVIKQPFSMATKNAWEKFFETASERARKVLGIEQKSDDDGNDDEANDGGGSDETVNRESAGSSNDDSETNNLQRDSDESFQTAYSKPQSQAAGAETGDKLEGGKVGNSTIAQNDKQIEEDNTADANGPTTANSGASGDDDGGDDDVPDFLVDV